MVDVVFPADVNAWKGGQAIDAAREPFLVECISAGTSWVQREGGVRSIGKVADATVYVDGKSATGPYRTDLHVPADVRPVWYLPSVGGQPAAADLTILEDGEELTVGVGYDAAADVILKNQNTAERLMLYRCGGWSQGTQNIELTLTHGWTHEDAASPLYLPAAVKLLIVEVAWLFFNGNVTVNKTSNAKGGASVSIADQLSFTARETLDSLRSFS